MPELTESQEHAPVRRALLQANLGGLWLPTRGPCPPCAKRGVWHWRTTKRGVPRALRAELRSSDRSPFFRKKKFPLTSLEAGLGPGPINALGSQALTHHSQSDSLAREPVVQQECAEPLQAVRAARAAGTALLPAPPACTASTCAQAQPEEQLCALYSSH